MSNSVLNLYFRLEVISKAHVFLREKTARRADIKIATVESLDLPRPVMQKRLLYL